MTRRAAHYTARIANDICMHIALGETLEGALAKVGYLAPPMSGVWRWLSEHEDFAIKYEQARTLQADTLADKSLSMVNDVLKNPKDAAAYRVAIDVLKWHAAIRNGKKYNLAAGIESKQVPLDANKIKAEIKRLEQELGVKEREKLKVVAMPVRQVASED